MIAPIGSPPRAWGQHNHHRNLWVIIRFTPTCVGTTLEYLLTDNRNAVHPHVRGDNYCSGIISNPKCGSPPRAWGQRSPSYPAAVRTRFTPTCVGTTPQRVITPAASAVHPHVRGDNTPLTP